MANGSVQGVKCPTCQDTINVRAIVDPGEPGYSGYGSYNGAGHPGSGAELVEVDYIEFDCGHDEPHLDEEFNRLKGPGHDEFWKAVDDQIGSAPVVEDEYDPS
jgi:hypothetical protein